MFSNNLFWHETSSEVEKSSKNRVLKFLEITTSPQTIGIFVGEISKTLNLAGYCHNYGVLTWYEFGNWKKNLKYRVSKVLEITPRSQTIGIFVGEISKTLSMTGICHKCGVLT